MSIHISVHPDLSASPIGHLSGERHTIPMLNIGALPAACTVLLFGTGPASVSWLRALATQVTMLAEACEALDAETAVTS